jgi:hypothetical protein
MILGLFYISICGTSPKTVIIAVSLSPRNQRSSIQINGDTRNDQTLNRGIKGPFPGWDVLSINAYAFGSPVDAQYSDDAQRLDDLKDTLPRVQNLQVFVVRIEHQRPAVRRLCLAIVNECGTVRVAFTT